MIMNKESFFMKYRESYVISCKVGFCFLNIKILSLQRRGKHISVFPKNRFSAFSMNKLMNGYFARAGFP